MHKIDTPGATEENEFQNRDPNTDTPGTVVGAAWLNTVQRELVAAIQSLGITLDKEKSDQLWTVIEKIYGKTHSGDPNGSVAADVLRERCWDISGELPALYIATAAGGTTEGTVWTPVRELVDYSADMAWATTTLTQDAVSHAIGDGWGRHAVYDADFESTFVVYGGLGMESHIVRIDHGSGVISDPVRIADYPIEHDNDHGLPALEVDGAGFLHVIYGSHNTEFYHARSDSPGDIAAWTIQGTGVSGTYPDLVYDPGTGHLYAPFRAGAGHDATYPSHQYMGLLRSTDGGASWSDEGPIVDLTGHPDPVTDIYAPSAEVVDGRVHIAFHIATGESHGDVRKNVYFLTYDPGDQNLYSIAGTNLGSTAEWADLDGNAEVEVYLGDNVSVPVLYPAGDGAPYIAFMNYEASPDAFAYRVGYWDGASWVVVDTGARTNSNGHQPALRHLGSGVIEAYFVTGRQDEPATYIGDGPENGSWYNTGGDLTVWRSSDGGDTWSEQMMIVDRTQIPTQGVGATEVPRNWDVRCPLVFFGILGDKTAGSVPGYFAVERAYQFAQATDRLIRSPTAVEQRTDMSGGPWDSVVDDTDPTSGSWVDVDLSSILPQNATHVLLELAVNGGGSENTYIKVREAGVGRDRDLSITCDGQQDFVMANWGWVPVSPSKKIEYWIANATAVARFRIHVGGFRTHG